MKKVIFKGAGVALITPMNADGSVNYETLESLIEFQVKNGTDAIISCGTTGESATLSAEERNDVIKFTIKQVAGRIPVIAGTGSNNTESALKNSLEAEELGADGLLIVTPYYNKTSQSGIIKHYISIAEKVNTPIVLYNVPSRTGLNIKPETCFELSKHPNICAIKEASGDISSVAKIAALCKENLSVYSGNDDQIVPVLSLGGIGVISVFSNICPHECHQIVKEYLEGNVIESKNLQLKYLELMNAMFCDVNPIPVKEALNVMGYNSGTCRLPLDTLSAENLKYIERIMRKYSLA